MEDMPPIPPDAYGETDIAVTLTWNDDYSLPVIIEDKVLAPFQPRQPERCAKRAGARAGVAVFVAPRSYIAGHLEQAKKFHGYITIEQIIERLESADVHKASDATSERRRQWRARLLSGLITRPPPPSDDLPTVQFTQFCVEWLHHRDSLAIPNPR